MHVDDETLSALIDDALPPAEAAAARQHLAACAACQEHYQELEQVVRLVRRLPEVEPPRAFTIGPHALGPTPRVRRLETWYDASRALTGALAAVFVLLLGARLYLGSTTPQSTLVPRAAPATATAAAPAPQTGAAPQAARVAPRTPAADQSGAGAAAAPAAQPAPAARLAASPASASAAAASTSAAAPAAAQPPAPAPEGENPLLASGWLVASLIVLLIAGGSTLLARHRLRQATSTWHDHP
jgi:hypothetical protein